MQCRTPLNSTRALTQGLRDLEAAGIMCRLHRTTDSLLVAVAEVDDAVSAPDRAIESNERRRLSGLADRSIGQKQRKIPLLLLRISFLPLLPPLLRCPLASLCVYSRARISRVVVSLSG